MTIRIVTDSTSDLPPELAARHGIIVLPAYINIGQESYLDGVELSRQSFYEQLPKFHTHPTTAAPAVGTFAQAYEKLADEGASEILSIHIAASLSGVLNSARLGAQGTDRIKVTVFDSRQITMGLGFLALSAAEDAAAGASMDEITANLEMRIPRVHVFAALDTLEYLRRSGRASWTEFGVGTLLRIKPLLHLYEGRVEPLEKVRTRQRAMKQLIQHVASLGQLEQVALLHTRNPEGAQQLCAQAQSLFPNSSTPPAVEVTPVIGAHVGPGALGFACMTAA